MAIKKNAAKATIKGPKKIPTKETVDTPISECEAENPMDCKYHGLEAFEKYVGAILEGIGYNGSKSVGKIQGDRGYVLYVPGFYNFGDDALATIQKAAKKKGFSFTNDGKNSVGAHEFLFKKDIPSKKKPKKKATIQDVLPLFEDAVELPDKASGSNSEDEADVLSQLDDIMEGEEALNDVLGELDEIMTGAAL